jgi:hypothetical protein
MNPEAQHIAIATACGWSDIVHHKIHAGKTNKMKTHQLNPEMFKSYEFEHEFASACGRGELKSLRVHVKDGVISYRVYVQREIQHNCETLIDAVNLYNLE